MEESHNPSVELILDLGRTLILTGTPTHRFEDTLTKVAKKLRLPAQFFALPTGFFAFIGPLNKQQTYFVRGNLEGANLGKIAELHDIVDEVLNDRLSPEVARGKIRQVARARSPHAPLLLLVANGLGSSLFTAFFGGGWREFVLAAVPGFAIGLVMLLWAGKPHLQRVVPTLGAGFAGLWSMLAAGWVPHMSPWIVMLGGIAGLIPGLGILIALNELSTGHLLAGSARAMATAMTLLQLVFGLIVARQLGEIWPQAVLNARVIPFPHWVKYVALLVAAPTYLVLFHARWRDWLAILVACFLSYQGSRLGSEWLGPEVGAGVGAYLLGVGCNLYARYRNKPAFVPLLPGMLLLVPGSIGIKSLNFLANHQIQSGMAAATQMVFVAMALLVGLLLSRVTVAPRKEL